MGVAHVTDAGDGRDVSRAAGVGLGPGKNARGCGALSAVVAGAPAAGCAPGVGAVAAGEGQHKESVVGGCGHGVGGVSVCDRLAGRVDGIFRIDILERGDDGRCVGQLVLK